MSRSAPKSRRRVSSYAERLERAFAATLKRSSILPDKERVLGRGSISASIVDDTTVEVTPEAFARHPEAVRYTIQEIGRAQDMVRTKAAINMEDALKVIAMERY